MPHRRLSPLIALVILIALCAIPAARHPAAAAAQPVNTTTSEATATSESIELLGSFGGTVNLLAVEGSTAYVREGSGLAIFDLSDFSQPTRRSYLHFPAVAVAADVVGTTAFIATNHDGLQIIDVTNPDSPQLLGGLATPGASLDVQAVSNLAYVLVGNQIGSESLRIIDVSNPTQPVLRGSYSLPDTPTDLEVAGTLAYVTVGNHGLKILDVSNPEHPALLGSFPFPDFADNVEVSGNRAYVGDTENPNIQSGLTILDVSNPANPVALGTYKPNSFQARDIEVVNNLAYIRNYANELRIVDVSNPDSPVVLGSYSVAEDMRSLLVVDNLAYVTMWNGFQIVDLSNPAHPALLGKLQRPWNVSAVSTAGTFVYIVALAPDRSEGLYIVDASDPSRPKLRAFYQTFVHDVQVVGSLAYLASGDKIEIVDVSNPDSPTLRSSHSAEAMHILVRGNLTYVSGTSSFSIFDVANPDNPAILGTYALQETPSYNFDVAGNFAYLTTGYCLRPCTFLLEIVDVSDPRNPRLRSVYEQFAHSVDVMNDRAYVSNGDIMILDVSNPDQPAPVAAYRTPNYALELEFVGGLAYIADGFQGGLHIAEVIHPELLRFRATYPTAGEARDLDVVGDLVYLANGADGLKIFRVHPDRFPSSIFVPLLSW